jgi:hypothetical protein
MKINSFIKFFAVAFLLASAALAVPTNSPPAAVTGKTKPCFQCKATGISPCLVFGCKDGQVDCPGPCLKLSKGVWQHEDVAGHAPTDLWQRFPRADGTWHMWNQNHVGDVIQMQNGEPVNIGKCKICGGSGHVKCSVCNGTGKVVCPICDGKKVVPDSWTAFDNPRLKDRPTHFKLKDGRVIIGRVKMTLGTTLTIRTETGSVDIETSDIVSQEKPAPTK